MIGIVYYFLSNVVTKPNSLNSAQQTLIVTDIVMSMAVVFNTTQIRSLLGKITFIDKVGL